MDMTEKAITAQIERLGLSRAKVCEAVGISRSYLSLIESGDRKIGPDKVCSLADALQLSVRDLRPDLAGIFADQKAEASGDAV